MKRINSPLPSFAVTVLALALLAAACGTDTAALDDLRSETDAEIASLEDDLVARDETITELEADAAEAVETISARDADIAEQASTIESLEGDVSSLESDVSAAESRAETAEARVDELLVTYDAEIRAAAQVAWDEAVATSCSAAGESELRISNFVDHDDELAIIGTEAELIDAVTACAEPLRNRSVVEKLNAGCTPGDVDALTRDTDVLIGDCLVMFVVPWQWDPRTGDCSFLGSWDPSNLGTRSFRYDGDGVFRAGSQVCANDLAESDQDDLLKLWVEVQGTFRYDTAAGGTNAIPDFTIVRAELVSKA